MVAARKLAVRVSKEWSVRRSVWRRELARLNEELRDEPSVEEKPIMESEIARLKEMLETTKGM